RKKGLAEAEAQRAMNDAINVLSDEQTSLKFKLALLQALPAVIEKSNDGGIDGIINQDPLGLRTVYVQVKRYSEKNIVGSPEINSFFGALRRKQADRGVFITTSSFTNDARDAAKQLNIALVDGEMLTNLMIQYKVGVQIRQNYELYNIDDDFFEE
ncbi:MAG: restriction endonuclease, partial [Lactobacillus paragasseri]|nr:restriction endonuclease [Lactobacillus paragasseri]